MIARTTEIGVERYGGVLEFDDGFIAGNLKPSALGKLYHSERGWPLSSIWPYRRPVLAPSAVDIGVIRNNENPREKHVGEMIHCSVIERLGKTAPVDSGEGTYRPPNPPNSLPADRIVLQTKENAAYCRCYKAVHYASVQCTIPRQIRRGQ